MSKLESRTRGLLRIALALLAAAGCLVPAPALAQPKAETPPTEAAPAPEALPSPQPIPITEVPGAAAKMTATLREHQPDRVEFRVVDGGHDWEVWAGTLPEALTYIFRFSSRPIAQGEKN